MGLYWVLINKTHTAHDTRAELSAPRPAAAHPDAQADCPRAVPINHTHVEPTVLVTLVCWEWLGACASHRPLAADPTDPSRLCRFRHARSNPTRHDPIPRAVPTNHPHMPTVLMSQPAGNGWARHMARCRKGSSMQQILSTRPHAKVSGTPRAYPRPRAYPTHPLPCPPTTHPRSILLVSPASCVLGMARRVPKTPHLHIPPVWLQLAQLPAHHDPIPRAAPTNHTRVPTVLVSPACWEWLGASHRPLHAADRTNTSRLWILARCKPSAWRWNKSAGPSCDRLI